MKKILIIIIIVAVFVAIAADVMAQGKYITKNGHISFYSEAPLENIEAHNHEVLSIINLEAKEMAVSMLMKGFSFEKSLMQEHFNENYVESDKFPKSTFKGAFTGAQPIDLSKDGVYEVEVTGDLTIHGVTKPITTKGTIEVKERQVITKTKFMVAVKDYEIEIPKIVVDNIAEEIEITVELRHSPMSS